MGAHKVSRKQFPCIRETFGKLPFRSPANAHSRANAFPKRVRGKNRKPVVPAKDYFAVEADHAPRTRGPPSPVVPPKDYFAVEANPAPRTRGPPSKLHS